MKDSKEDETTPGPIYNTQYINSINSLVDNTSSKTRGNFGLSRDETIDSRHSKPSPGPAKYYCDYSGHRVKLSVKKTAQEFSVPKNDRGLLVVVKKENSPNPQSYKNTNEISNKLILRNPGNPGLPKQERKIDFCKYSQVHQELVVKGLY